jgi:hypothetical protein
MINFKKIETALKQFKNKQPFDHSVVDGFFDLKVARLLEQDFPNYEDSVWFEYNNLLEHKKALNDWNKYPALTYQIFMMLNSPQMIRLLEKYVGVSLFPDFGLHGGGWHIHGQGGKLNPHLDYSIHPKCGLQRKLNIIIYLSEQLNPKKHQGHLGLWSQDKKTNQPRDLIREIAPEFNRAIIFDTTQDSWHGMSRKLEVPKGIYRKSLAIYYLSIPNQAKQHQRALYAPLEDQKNNKLVLETIKLRADVNKSTFVYKKK